MGHWTFVHVADIHVGSPRSYRFQPAWNENWRTARKQIVEIKPDLLLVGGDLTRDGNLHRFELEAIKADLDALPFPYHVVPGNMDTGNKHTDVSGPARAGRADDVDLNLRSDQLHQYSSIFGPTQWSFVHRGVRFSGLCDMLAGSGLPEEEPFWDWAESQPRLPRGDHHIWVMHSALFIEDLQEPNFDITDPEQYHDWYFGMDEPHRSRLFDAFKSTGVDIVISGHVHCRKAHSAQGVRFDIAPSTASPQCASRWPDGDPSLGFLRYDVTQQGVGSTFVPLERISTEKGYGPGGHPPPDLHDYSLAWEQGWP